jgi:hypothetical protein
MSLMSSALASTLTKMVTVVEVKDGEEEEAVKEEEEKEKVAPCTTME